MKHQDMVDVRFTFLVLTIASANFAGSLKGMRYRVDPRIVGQILQAILLCGIVASLSSCTVVPARCEYADFAIGSSHMTNTIAEPYVVQTLRGRFVPDFGDPDVAVWLSDEHMIRLQVNGPNGFSAEVPVAKDGAFQVDGIRPGRYCFKSSSQSFQGYEGVIIVAPRAPSQSITIRVALGV